VDSEHGYCFGMQINFDPSLDSEAVQAEVAYVRLSRA